MKRTIYAFYARHIHTITVAALATLVPIHAALAGKVVESERSAIVSSSAEISENSSAEIGQLAGRSMVPIAVTLPLRNGVELDQLLRDLYDPKRPLFHKFLTPAMFTARYCPTDADYQKVIAFAQSYGLHVTGTHPNRTVLDLSGTAASEERAFAVHLRNYVSNHHITFHGPDQTPTVPVGMASKISGIIGLENAEQWHTHAVPLENSGQDSEAPRQIGTGKFGGLSPNDIRTAYSLNKGTLTGAGQTTAIFELDGFNQSDISTYEAEYGLPNVNVVPVPIDGYDGSAGSNAGEVTLDIELQIAAAPGLAKVLVYEGPNSNIGVIDLYSRIATDNLAKQVSTSWGLAESRTSSDVLQGESTAFKQMAAQGQTIFAASGDSGAYDDGKNLSVDDPASQPYVTGVGGTALALNTDHSFLAETTWNHGSIASGASGGGVSNIWTRPYWQALGGASSTMRNVPDVSLDSDPNTGYSIFYKGSWVIFGGTSCGSPIWAGFTALVNQQRAAYGSAPVGFLNPTLYALGFGDRSTYDFHDIADGSTNLNYLAGPGYDNATGFGSMNGTELLADLAPHDVLKFVAEPSVIRRRGAIWIRWTTNLVATTAIHIGTSPDNLNYSGLLGRATIFHGVNVYGLTRAKRYYFTVESDLGDQKVLSPVMSAVAL